MSKLTAPLFVSALERLRTLASGNQVRPSVMRVEQRGSQQVEKENMALDTAAERKRRLGPFAKFAASAAALNLAGMDLIPAIVLAQPALHGMEDALRKARDSAAYRRIESTIEIYRHNLTDPAASPFSRFARAMANLKQKVQQLIPERVFLRSVTDYPPVAQRAPLPPVMSPQPKPIPLSDPTFTRNVPAGFMEGTASARMQSAASSRLDALAAASNLSAGFMPTFRRMPMSAPAAPAAPAVPAAPATAASFLDAAPAAPAPAAPATAPITAATPPAPPVPIVRSNVPMEDSALGRALLRMRENEMENDRTPVIHIERRTAATVAPAPAVAATPAPAAPQPVPPNAQDPSSMGVFAKFAMSSVMVAGMAASLYMTQDTGSKMLSQIQSEHAAQKAEAIAAAASGMVRSAGGIVTSAPDRILLQAGRMAPALESIGNVPASLVSKTKAGAAAVAGGADTVYQAARSGQASVVEALIKRKLQAAANPVSARPSQEPARLISKEQAALEKINPSAKSNQPTIVMPDPVPVPLKKPQQHTPQSVLKAISKLDQHGIRLLPVKFQGKQMDLVHPADRVSLAKEAAAKENLNKHLGPDAWKVVYAVITAESNWMPRDGMGANKRKSYGIAQMEMPTANALKIDPTNPREAAVGVAKLITEATNTYQQRARSGLVVRDEKGRQLPRQVALATYLSVHYNTSSDMRQKWDGSVTNLEQPTRHHISNLRYGINEAASVDRQIKTLTPEEHDQRIARQINAEAQFAAMQAQEMKAKTDALTALENARGAAAKASDHAKSVVAVESTNVTGSLERMRQARADMISARDALVDHEQHAFMARQMKVPAASLDAVRNTLLQNSTRAKLVLDKTAQVEEAAMAASYQKMEKAMQQMHAAQAAADALSAKMDKSAVGSRDGAADKVGQAEGQTVGQAAAQLQQAQQSLERVAHYAPGGDSEEEEGESASPGMA